MRIGVALGSGSSHGLAHIGAIEELEARGMRVDVVAGTSAGAVVGALWASGSSGAEIENLSRYGDWESMDRFSPSWQSLFSSEGLRANLKRLLPDRPIEAWPRRFGAVATDMDTGRRRVLASGDGTLAVMASSAMPVAYSPVTIDGRALADGALVEPVPSRTARELGADFVIAIDVAYRPYEDRARGLVQSGFQALHVMVNALAAEQDRYADYVVRMDVHRVYMECGAQAMVYAGRRAMRDAWPAIEAALARSRRSGAAR
jgi:NTE family protein